MSLKIRKDKKGAEVLSQETDVLGGTVVTGDTLVDRSKGTYGGAYVEGKIWGGKGESVITDNFNDKGRNGQVRTTRRVRASTIIASHLQVRGGEEGNIATTLTREETNTIRPALNFEKRFEYDGKEMTGEECWKQTLKDKGYSWGGEYSRSGAMLLVKRGPGVLLPEDVREAFGEAGERLAKLMETGETDTKKLKDASEGLANLEITGVNKWGALEVTTEWEHPMVLDDLMDTFGPDHVMIRDAINTAKEKFATVQKGAIVDAIRSPKRDITQTSRKEKDTGRRGSEMNTLMRELKTG